MERLLPDTVKVILGGLLLIALALAWIVRARPQVAWLQAFRLPSIDRTEEEKARRRRSGNRLAALQMILAGVALPIAYCFSRVMLVQ